MGTRWARWAATATAALGMVIAPAAAPAGATGAAAPPGSVPVAGAVSGQGPAPSVERVAGASRYDVAAKLSAQIFEPGVPVVYVTSGEKFPDALSGGPVAAKAKAPMLLTLPGAVPPAVDTELRRLRPGKVVVLGGTASVDRKSVV